MISKLGVTPFVGVWIETTRSTPRRFPRRVTPFVGVWIETVARLGPLVPGVVTPFVGVWIETAEARRQVRGCRGHTLRGCVD